jgi:predicted nucleic acid-binding protein
VCRAALDTNVIGWRRRDFGLVVSPAILDEVARTLLLPRIARRYHVTAPEGTELGRLLRTRSLVLTNVPPLPPTVRDLTDDHVLALAFAGHVSSTHLSGTQPPCPLTCLTWQRPS